MSVLGGQSFLQQAMSMPGTPVRAFPGFTQAAPTVSPFPAQSSFLQSGVIGRNLFPSPAPMQSSFFAMQPQQMFGGFSPVSRLAPSTTTPDISSLITLIQSLIGNLSPQGVGGLDAQALASGFGSPKQGHLTAAQTGKAPIIAQLDDFAGTGEAGNTNSDLLAMNGASVKHLNVNVSGKGRSQAIADGLEKVLKYAQSGQQLDVVNIQQQDFTASADTMRAQKLINQLTAMGIPVVVSAGLSMTPNVDNVHNQLTTKSSINVQATAELEEGLTAVPGNVKQGGTHAPARVSAKIALMSAQGLTLAQIKQRLGFM